MAPPAGRARGAFRRQVHGSRAPVELHALLAGPVSLVDALGTFCPEPVIRIQDAARAAGQGEILVLLADDAGVEVDIPAWCMSTGHEYLGLLKEPSRYRVLVRIASAGRSGATRSGT